MEHYQAQRIISLLQQLVDGISDLNNKQNNDYCNSFIQLINDIQRNHQNKLQQDGSIWINPQRIKLIQCANLIRQQISYQCHTYKLNPKDVYQDYKLGIDISIYLRKQIAQHKDSYALMNDIRRELITNGKQAAQQKVALLILERQ